MYSTEPIDTDTGFSSFFPSFSLSLLGPQVIRSKIRGACLPTRQSRSSISGEKARKGRRQKGSTHSNLYRSILFSQQKANSRVFRLS